jgi:hypothetical protein
MDFDRNLVADEVIAFVRRLSDGSHGGPNE